jgi:biopolymer transport protein ExbD
MKRHHMPEMKEGGVNVTPLIDIVMCLIIFFMLVAKIGVSRGEDKDIVLPSTILGTKIEDLGNTLTLNIHPTSGDEPQVTALVNGSLKEVKLLDNHGAGKVDYPLQRVLEKFKEVNKEKAKVIIRADKEVVYRQLQLVLVTIANAGIGDVAYETKKVESTEVSSQ